MKPLKVESTQTIVLETENGTKATHVIGSKKQKVVLHFGKSQTAIIKLSQIDEAVELLNRMKVVTEV